jgi:putative ABC transport system substrate-binding protein
MRLRPVTLVVTFALGLLVGPLPAEAQQAGKIHRIGFLSNHSGSPATEPRLIALQQGLRELGYVEGQNLVIEYRSPEGKRERRAEMAAELVRLKVDVIVAPPSPGAIRALQRATRTIPIVMGGIVTDPVKAGFVDSLRRPGGNITGLTKLDTELHGKRLELLKEAIPRISRVAILWPRGQQNRAIKEVKAVGQALGIQIQTLIVPGLGTLDDLDRAFSTLSQDSPDALLVAPSYFVLAYQARIIEFTAKRRLPTIYSRSRVVKAGGLMSYNADTKDLVRSVATYIDKILNGATPADLPIEQPKKFELIINLKTAKKLGLTFSPQFLARADRVIK